MGRFSENKVISNTMQEKRIKKKKKKQGQKAEICDFGNSNYIIAIAVKIS